MDNVGYVLSNARRFSLESIRVAALIFSTRQEAFDYRQEHNLNGFVVRNVSKLESDKLFGSGWWELHSCKTL